MEEKIREHEKAAVERNKAFVEPERAAVQLKRSRNALLNISKLPPEVLGNIFQCNVTPRHDFDWLEEGSHNFLFVCHHWHEVALCTPGVWSFWGNTLVDWARWHRYSGTAPLDLILGHAYGDDDGGRPFDIALHDALQEHATRDTIRRIHLSSNGASLLRSIISSLTTVCEEVRSNSVESLILLNGAREPVDVSDFFIHHRFPRLQHLALRRCSIASWNLLISRTADLTTLVLHFHNSPPAPTISQLFHILTSNPTLMKLSLSQFTIPNDGGGKFPLRVPLRHLKELELAGGLQHVFGLLSQLDHPGKMNRLEITLFNCAVTDIPHTIGPYLRDHFRHRGRSRNWLGLGVTQLERHVTLSAGDMCGTGLPFPMTYPNQFLNLHMQLGRPGGLLEKGLLDLVAHTPLEDIVRFESSCGFATVENICAQFPNLRALRLGLLMIPLPTMSPESTMDGDEEVLPSLQHIEFRGRPYRDDWSPLMAFLTRRASSGDRLRSLTISESHVCPEVRERIRSIVQGFCHIRPMGQCSFGTCSEQ